VPERAWAVVSAQPASPSQRMNPAGQRLVANAGWGIDRNSRRRTDQTVNRPSPGGGVFGGGAYEAQAKNDDQFLSRLAVAEQRDLMNRQQLIRPNASSLMLGDDSRVDQRQWRTSNEMQQERVQQTHKIAMQREEDRKLMQIMVDEHGLTAQQARQEISLYRKEQTQQEQQQQLSRQQQQQVMSPPQQPQRRPQTAPVEQPPPRQRRPQTQVLQPPGGASSLSLSDGSSSAADDLLTEQFQHEWNQKYGRRGKGGPKAPGGLATDHAMAPPRQQPAASCDWSVGSRPAGAPRSLLAGQQGDVHSRQYRHDAHQSHFDIFSHSAPDRPPAQQPPGRPQYQHDATLSSVPGGIFARGVWS